MEMCRGEAAEGRGGNQPQASPCSPSREVAVLVVFVQDARLDVLKCVFELHLLRRLMHACGEPRQAARVRTLQARAAMPSAATRDAALVPSHCHACVCIVCRAF
jgi:hypothetical protein